MRKLNLTLALVLFVGICAIAFTRSGEVTLQPGQSLDWNPAVMAKAKSVKPDKSMKKTPAKLSSEDRVALYEFGQSEYECYVYFTSMNGRPAAGENYIEYTVPDGDGEGAFINYGATRFFRYFDEGMTYRFTMLVEADNSCEFLATLATLGVNENGNITSWNTVGSEYNCYIDADNGWTSANVTLEFTSQGVYPYPSLFFDFVPTNGEQTTVRVSNIVCEVYKGPFADWDDDNFNVTGSWGSYSEDSKPMSCRTNNDSKWTYYPDSNQFNFAGLMEDCNDPVIVTLDDINIRAGEFYNIVYNCRSNTSGWFYGQLYALNEDGSETYVENQEIYSNYMSAYSDTGCTIRLPKNHDDIKDAVLKIYFELENNTEENDIWFTVNHVVVSTDYVDLSAYPQAVFDEETGLYGYEENGVKYTFEAYDNGTLGYIYRITTDAEEIAVPEKVVADGKLVCLDGIATHEEDFYVHCPNLRVINAPQVKKIIFNNGVGCKLERINVHVLEQLDNISQPMDDGRTVYLYAEVPGIWNMHRYDGGCLRTLVGYETPDAPAGFEDVYFWIPDENGMWIGYAKNAQNGSNWYDCNYRVVNVAGEGEEVYVPATIAFPADEHVANVFMVGNYDSFASQAPNLVKLHVPVSLSYINIDWECSNVRNIYMEGEYDGHLPQSDDWIYPEYGLNVYAATEETYYALKSDNQWQNAAIVPYGWDFEFMVIDVKRRGEFAQTYIEMTDADWNAGHYVKVMGNLNENDLRNMRNMTSLEVLDISEADFEALPNNWMENMSNLRKVILPDFVTVIPASAFIYCYSLSEVVCPSVEFVKEYAFQICRNLKTFDMSGLKYIGNGAFSGCSALSEANVSDCLVYIGSDAFCNTAIKSFVVPDKVTQIASGAFEDCRYLQSVTLPAGLTYIGSYAFENTKITELAVPEGVTSIGAAAFRYCYDLASISLPTSLTDVGAYMFEECNSLRDVVCKAVTPPACSGNFTSGMDMNHCTLRVAPFSISEYREDQYWGRFLIVKPLAEPISDIVIDRPMTFDLLSEDNDVLAGNPTMTLKYNTSNSRNGQLSAYGDGTLSAGQFTMWGFLGRRTDYMNYSASLINNAENMRADNVTLSFQVYKDCWHFFSLPFDCAMSDVTANEGTDFVIRRYDSEARAAQGETLQTSSWVAVGPDETLLAGQGYIIQAANNVSNEFGNSQNAYVRFNSGNTLTKNNIFRSGNYIARLKEYPAEFAHNRSWNFVGNPYPCFYRLNELLDDFYQPVTIWRGNSYQAYSPIDDDVVLRPFEAFFVQCPLETTEMTFSGEGRLHYDEATYLYSYNGTRPGYRAPEASARRVFNFTAEGMGADDRARVVINPDAERSYGAGDAAKMFAETSNAIELYVVDGVDYAICERPLDNGETTLGIKVAEKGEYTVTLDTRNAEGCIVELIDNLTGSVIDLTAEAYTFESEAGLFGDRFTVRFLNVPSGIDTVLADNAEVAIYSLQGLKVYEGLFGGFSGAKGIYVVVCGDNSYKIEL